MPEPILAGIRVVDLSWGLAGPVAALLLAEAGADVVKVEPPGGDPLRASHGFATWNRSKRGACLDLREPEDRAALGRWIDAADVLIHSLRPGDARRLGLDDATLHRAHPRLVTCAVLGYPIDSADAERPGYDALVQARLGLMDEQQGHRDGPVFLRFPIPSWGAAYLAAAGILARLLARRRSGRGGPAHTSLLQGALTTLTMHWARAERPDPAFAAGLPKSMLPSLFECGDGVWIHVMAPAQEVPLVAETLAALTPDELEAARARRGDAPGYFGDQVAFDAAYRRRPSGEWLKALWEAGIPVLPAQRLGEVLFDAQAVGNGYVVEVDDPVLGRTRQAGPPFHIEPPARVRGPAPALGQHTREVWDAWSGAAEDAPSGAGGLPRHPLEGLRVLDLGNFLAGPFAAMLLADLGADVIKLEAPRGDLMRGVSRVFAGCQRGKRGVAVDLKRPEARPLVESLVRWADVVHHNLRTPAARRLGVDYESLARVNPRLVYCHTSSYGPRGPRADWPGFDQLFQAYSGWEVEGGGEGNPPMWHRMGMMDHQNALASLVATLLGLERRERTGRGGMVSASILGACVLTASETLVLPGGGLAPHPRLDREQTGISPWYRIYRARDAWIAVAALRDVERTALLAAVGVDAPGALAGAIAGRAAAPLLAALESAGVPAERVRVEGLDPFFDEADHRRTRLAVSYPHSDWGELEQIGALWSFGDLALRLDLAPPALGQHTREVLEGLGFDAAALRALAASGVIAGPGLDPPDRPGSSPA